MFNKVISNLLFLNTKDLKNVSPEDLLKMDRSRFVELGERFLELKPEKYKNFLKKYNTEQRTELVSYAYNNSPDKSRILSNAGNEVLEIVLKDKIKNFFEYFILFHNGKLPGKKYLKAKPEKKAEPEKKVLLRSALGPSGFDSPGIVAAITLNTDEIEKILEYLDLDSIAKVFTELNTAEINLLMNTMPGSSKIHKIKT